MQIIERRTAQGGTKNIPLSGVKVGMEYSRPLPAAWQRELDAICPSGPGLHRLWLRWEAGDPWQPIERWVIWSLLPRWITHDFERSTTYQVPVTECEGPHPRSEGHYCAAGWCRCEVKTDGWRDGPVHTIDRGTWEVYRETGLLGRRWWIIQGENGGHRHKLEPWERKIWHIVTGLPDTPAPGDLPYAPWDARVKRHLTGEVGRMQFLGAIRRERKGQMALDSEDKAKELMAKQALAAWTTEQFEGVWDYYGTLLKREARKLGSGAYVHDQYYNPDEVAESYGLS